MRTRVIIFGILCVLMLVVPLLSPIAAKRNGTEIKIERQPEKPASGRIIKIYDKADGKVMTLDMREYLIGAVMSEMPAEYGSEALKAQAIATHSYALCVEKIQQQSPSPELCGAAFAVNTDTLEGFVTDRRARNIFGDSYDKYYIKISSAVDEVLNLILTCDGEPIAACYHAISPGMTEYSENVFGSPRSYLVAVDSSLDTTASDYLSTAEFTSGELSALLRQYDGSEPSGKPSEWLGTPSYSKSGTVLNLNIGGTEYTGQQLRSALSLRSAAFDVVYENSKFVFTVRGYGHAVGMSQYGANCLAAQGYDYTQILSHYYPTAELTTTE